MGALKENVYARYTQLLISRLFNNDSNQTQNCSFITAGPVIKRSNIRAVRII